MPPHMAVNDAEKIPEHGFQVLMCTYRQSRDHTERYRTFLSQNQRDLITGGTAARILRLEV